jgi:hypothetical protein
VKQTRVTEYDWMMLGAMPGALALVISPVLYLYAQLFHMVPIFAPLLLGYQSCVMPFVLVGGLILVQRNKQRWPVWMNVWYYLGLAINLVLTASLY